MKTMRIEEAIELEGHFDTAAKALRCAHRNMQRIDQEGFESTMKEVEQAAGDAEAAKARMRNWVSLNS